MNRRRVLGAIVVLVLLLLAAAPFVIRKPRRYYTDGAGLRADAHVTAAWVREVLWEPAAPVAGEVNTPGEDEYEPRVSPDGRLLVFTRGRPGGGADLWVAERALDGIPGNASGKRGDSGWGSPRPLDELNSPGDDMGGCFASSPGDSPLPAPPEGGRPGGSEALFFYSDRPGGQGRYDLWVSLRREDGSWASPENLGPSVNSPLDEIGPAVSADGSGLYFTSNRRSGKASELPRWVATLRETYPGADYDVFRVPILEPSPPGTAREGETGPFRFGEVSILERVSSAGTSEGSPSIATRAEVLYFASDRAGGRGGFDLYRARATGGRLGPPENLGPQLNSQGHELDPAISPGGFEIHFARRADASPEGNATEDIFHSVSREVFVERERGEPAWSITALLSFLGALLRRIRPEVLAIILSLLVALLFGILFGRRITKIALFTRCVLFALLVHIIIAIWMNSSEVQRLILTSLPPDDGFFEVALDGSSEESVGFSIRNEVALTGADGAAPSFEIALPPGRLGGGGEAGAAPVPRFALEAAAPQAPDTLPIAPRSAAPEPPREVPHVEVVLPGEASLPGAGGMPDAAFNPDPREGEGPEATRAAGRGLDLAASPVDRLERAPGPEPAQRALPEAASAMAGFVGGSPGPSVPDPPRDPGDASGPPSGAGQIALPLALHAGRGAGPEERTILSRGADLGAPRASAPSDPALDRERAVPATGPAAIPGGSILVRLEAPVGQLEAARGAAAITRSGARPAVAPGPIALEADEAQGTEIIAPALPGPAGEPDEAPGPRPRALAPGTAPRAEAARALDLAGGGPSAGRRSGTAPFSSSSPPIPSRSSLATAPPGGASLHHGDSPAGLTASGDLLPSSREDPSPDDGSRLAGGKLPFTAPAGGEPEVVLPGRPESAPAAEPAREGPAQVSVSRIGRGSHRGPADAGAAQDRTARPRPALAVLGNSRGEARRASWKPLPPPTLSPAKGRRMAEGGAEPGGGGAEIAEAAVPPGPAPAPEAATAPEIRAGLAADPGPRRGADDLLDLISLAAGGRSDAAGSGEGRAVEASSTSSSIARAATAVLGNARGEGEGTEWKSPPPPPLSPGKGTHVEAGGKSEGKAGGAAELAALPAIAAPASATAPEIRAASAAPGTGLDPAPRGGGNLDLALAPRASGGGAGGGDPRGAPGGLARPVIHPNPGEPARGGAAAQPGSPPPSRDAAGPPRAVVAAAPLPPAAHSGADEPPPAPPSRAPSGGAPGRGAPSGGKQGGELTSEAARTAGRIGALEPEMALRRGHGGSGPRAEPSASLSSIPSVPAVASRGKGAPLAPSLPEPSRGLLLATGGAEPMRAVVTPSASREAPGGSSFVPKVYQLREKGRREEAVRAGGGGTDTEKAVERGLRWLALHQSPDGRWSLFDYTRHLRKTSPRDIVNADWDGRGRNDSRGGAGRAEEGDTAATGLAVLAFLGHGDTHLQPGPFQENVRKGLGFLIKSQRRDGDLRGGGNLYMHAIAAFAVCEAYALTRDAELAEAARRAVGFTLRSQNPDLGGWRYDPYPEGTDVDTSVFGWMLMALKSARVAGIEIPERHVSRMARYLESARMTAAGGRYAYQPGLPRTSLAMTAQGFFCQQILSELQPPEADEEERFRGAARESVAHLLKNRPVARDQDGANEYYWYYATLSLFQEGGQAWQAWNARLKEVLLELQLDDRTGTAAGSWDPLSRRAKQGGRVYSTAMSILCLEVYYRYAPRKPAKI